MTSKDREIISFHYHKYCENRANGDPVGGYEDINSLFKDLANSDPKLKEMLEEEFESVFPDNDE